MFSVVPVGLKSYNQDLLCLKHDKKIVLYDESVGFELIKHIFRFNWRLDKSYCFYTAWR